MGAERGEGERLGLGFRVEGVFSEILDRDPIVPISSSFSHTTLKSIEHQPVKNTTVDKYP